MKCLLIHCIPACNYSYLTVFVVAMSAMVQKTADPNENTVNVISQTHKGNKSMENAFWKSFPATHCSSSLN